MTALATPQFAPNPRRRALIGKVKLAAKQLGLIDDDYRQILFDVAGVRSAADCTEAQLVAIVERFKARGFRPAAPASAARPARPRPADHPMARKARAMWISLHQLGAVRDPRESALEAFASRQLGVERLQWADQARSYQLVEALKAMAERAGWRQDVAGLDAAHRVHALKLRLADAILAKLRKLGMVARHWSTADAAFHLFGERPANPAGFDDQELDRLCAAMGALLRKTRGLPGDDL